MSRSAAVQSMIEDWYDEFYQMIVDHNPEWSDDMVMREAEALVEKRLEERGE